MNLSSPAQRRLGRGPVTLSPRRAFGQVGAFRSRLARGLAVVFGLALALLVAGGSASAAESLSRTNLLAFTNAAGEVRPVTRVEEWALRRASILAAMQSVMGPLPGPEKRCPLAVEQVEEVDCGSYVRRLISYAAEPGGRVPAYLLVPK